MNRSDRSARILVRARLWTPLAVVAAVPVSILLAGGSSPRPGPEATLVAAIPSETNTTTGIGRSLCHIIGTQACKDPTTTASTAGTGTGTDATDSSDTATTTTTSGAMQPPDGGVCGHTRFPGVCPGTSTSSTVTVEPPSSLSTRTRHTHTKSARSKTASAATQQSTTVTVTVTRSSSTTATSTTTTGGTGTTTGATTGTSTR